MKRHCLLILLIIGYSALAQTLVNDPPTFADAAEGNLYQDADGNIYIGLTDKSLKVLGNTKAIKSKNNTMTVSADPNDPTTIEIESSHPWFNSATDEPATSMGENLYTNGSVSIGGNTFHDSAILTLNSTSKGFLPPVLTTAQRDAIVSPVEGLLIYNSESKCTEFYTGNFWNNICNETEATITCASFVVNGNYSASSAVNSTHFVQITIDVTKAGTFQFFTNTKNGLNFSYSGNLDLGQHTINLIANGTPSAAGNHLYTLFTGNDYCEFNLTVN